MTSQAQPTNAVRHLVGGLFWRRFASSLIDLSLCVFIPFFGWGILTPFLPEQLLGLWIPAIAILIVSYVTIFSMRGATLGMKLMHLRLLRAGSAESPHFGQALLRGLTALLGAASGILVVAFGFSDPPASGYGRGSIAIIVVVAVVAVISIFGRLWMLFDHERRTLFDHLYRVVVVDTSKAVPDN